jgi:hypothetical protein
MCYVCVCLHAVNTGSAANGEIIASSDGYKSKAAAENGVTSVRTNASSATVVDKTG